MADRAPPTPLAMLIGTAIIAGVSGYMIGIASSLGIIPIPFMPKAPKARGIANYDDEEESEEEDIDESILDHAPNWANGLEADKRDGLRATTTIPTTNTQGSEKETKTKHDWEDKTAAEECKMVLVVRTDLGMTKGIFPSFLILTAANKDKAKSEHNADTRLSHATRLSSARARIPLFVDDGSAVDSQRLLFKSRARMSS